MEYLYGREPVLAALSAARRSMRQLLLYATAAKAPEVLLATQLATQHSIPIQYTTLHELDRKASNRPHQVPTRTHP